MMAGIGFSDAVTTQLSLAELHGNLALSLGENQCLPRKHAQGQEKAD